MQNSSDLEQSILLTIIYYDAFKKPLTAFELWKYLMKPNSFRISNQTSQISNLRLYDIIEVLNHSDYLKSKISHKNGFYFLKHRSEKFFYNAIKTDKICAQKIKRSKRYIKLIKYLPFVRAIFLSGSVAVGYASENSDLDLLIVIKNKKIWLARLLIVFITFLFGIKRSSENPKKYKDKICLNHFITDKSLKIPFQSIYTAQNYARLLPLYDEDSYYVKFYEQNQWLKKYFWDFHFVFYQNKDKKNLIKSIFEIIFEVFNLIFGFLIKYSQVWHIKKNPLTYKSGGRVTYNDAMLEFHPNSKEKNIIEKYNKMLIKYGFNDSYFEKDSGLKK